MRALAALVLLAGCQTTPEPTTIDCRGYGGLSTSVDALYACWVELRPASSTCGNCLETHLGYAIAGAWAQAALCWEANWTAVADATGRVHVDSVCDHVPEALHSEELDLATQEMDTAPPVSE